MFLTTALSPVAPTNAGGSRETRAERLVSKMKSVPVEDFRRQVREAKGMSSAEMETRQREIRRARAVAAAARIRSI